MFSKSKLNVRGRWMIFALFVICVLLPEVFVVTVALMGINPKADPVAVMGLALVRLIWMLPLFYFMLMGHNWARYLAIVLFVLSLAVTLGVMDKETLPFLIAPAILIGAAAGILLFSKSVQPRRRY
jgi:heme/copper-type cytochrome/quinol oxidase subunit 4